MMSMNQALLDGRRLRAAITAWGLDCAKRMRARRIELGITQGALAEAVGVRQSAISSFESAITVPTDRVRVAIAVALFCEVSDIWPPIGRSEALAFTKAAA